MAYKACENCGTRLYSGICSNCQEELHILEFQGEFIDFPLSDEFMKKATDQEAEVEKRRVKDKALTRQEEE